MTKEITPMRAWMAAATTAEQLELATALGSSRDTLYQLASGHRGASAERAIAIEQATQEIHKRSKGRLPVVYRTDMSPACGGCEFARRCLGEAAVRSEFPILGGG